MNMKNVFAVFKKEVRAYLYSPTTYIIAGVFIAVWEYLFFQNVFLGGEASVQGLFLLLPWFFLLFIPAITMGSIAEEVNKETLEILLTHPIKDRELIFGKYLSALAFTVVILLPSLAVALSLKSFGDLDLGVYVGELIASILLASALISLGIAVSTYFKNQVPALLVSVVSVFGLIIIGEDIVTMSLPTWLGTFFARLSVLPYFQSISRGVLDVRDVWYFLAFTALFLEIGHLKLIVRKISRYSRTAMKQRTVVLVLLAILVVPTALGLLPNLRIDLTEGNIYTLTSATKDILRELDTDIVITLYESKNLPAQLQTTVRTVKDVLKDYRTYGGSRLSVEYKNPDEDQVVAQKAQEEGVYPVQFNTVGSGEFEVKQGFFGIAVKKGEEKKSIPIVQSTADLEYQLTSFISELTKTEKKKVAFLDVAGKTSAQAFTVLAGELKRQFVVEDISLTQASSTIEDDVDVLVVATPSGSLSEHFSKGIEEYLAKGKSALFLVDGVEVNPQYMIALPNGTTTEKVFSSYGLTPHVDLAYDLGSNETVQVGGGGVMYFLPYPPYIKASLAEGVFPGSRLTAVTIPWGSTVSVDEGVVSAKGLTALPLIKTSKHAGVQTENFTVSAQGPYPKNDLQERFLGVLLKPQNDSEENLPRIVLIGDSDFLSDAFAGNVPQNIAFGMELMSYLGKESSLANIKLKEGMSRPLTFEDQKQTVWVKYGNMGGALLVLVALGVFLITSRSRKRGMTYKEGKNL